MKVCLVSDHSVCLFIFKFIEDQLFSRKRCYYYLIFFIYQQTSANLLNSLTASFTFKCLRSPADMWKSLGVKNLNEHLMSPVSGTFWCPPAARPRLTAVTRQRLQLLVPLQESQHCHGETVRHNCVPLTAPLLLTLSCSLALPRHLLTHPVDSCCSSIVSVNVWEW